MTATALATPHADASFAARQLSAGLQHYTAGRIDEAISAYQSGLGFVENEPPGVGSAETVAELHSNLGNACMVRGDLETAASNYKAALRLAPHLTSCWCNLGNVHLRTGRAQDAVTLYLQALTTAPGHWPSRTNLVQALMATQQYLMARMLLTELVDERPRDARLHHQLGKLHFELNELDSALQWFRQAAAIDAGDADSRYWIGSILQKMDDIEGATTAYAEAARIQPLIRRPAARSPAEFRVLALFAPFAGNTPPDYLLADAAYDTDTLAVFESGEYDVALLQRDVHVVVNLISDADQAETVLPLAADLAAGIGRPIVNDPRNIGRTTRDAVADLLQGIPGCRVPKVLRQKAGCGLSDAGLRTFPLSPPVLARPVGTHGGDDFEKIEGQAELADLLARRCEADRYLIEYIDYRSTDGYFRKYRFIFVDGQILPYHLAIADDWKVHHDNTDMADHRWMQSEEEAFLNDPSGIFNSGHYGILQEIQRRVGLEYFGIDCGLDRSGNLVVFEANASMLVHAQNEKFPYKTAFVLRIKRAFDEMLRRIALGRGARTDCAAFE